MTTRTTGMTTTSTIAAIAVLLAVALLAGCADSGANGEAGAAPATDANGAVDTATQTPVDQAPATTPAPARPAPRPAAPRPAPQPVVRTATLTVPAGSVIQVSFDQDLASNVSQPGDRFSVTVVEPVAGDDGQTVIDAGSIVSGSVVEAKTADKRIGGKAMLTLQFDSVSIAGIGEVPINASFHAEGKSQTGKDAATIGGAAAGGALLGRIIGKHKSDSTKIGAVVGAAVGTAVAASNKGEEVEIVGGTVLPISLDAPMSVTVEL